jgi:Fe-S oxidoreductase
VSEITRVVWWNVPAWLGTLLYVGTAAGVLVSAVALARQARALIRARPLGAAPDFRVGPAVRRVLGDVLSHRRLLEDAPGGWAHALLFYGFLGLFVGTCLVFVHDRVVSFLVGPTYLVFSFLLEWAGLAFLAGVGWTAWRRLGGRVARLERSGVALAILALLAAIGVTGFLVEAARIAATDPPFEAWSFVGWTLARALRAVGMTGAPLHQGLWGLHAGLTWLFFGLIGATILRHMVAAPVQLALRQLRPPGRLASPTPEPGALAPTRLTWAQLLDAATCVRCGRCTAVCPATAAGKPLDPRRVVQATLHAMRESRPLETLVTPDEAWSCTTCAACVRACPFEIEVLDKLVDLRRGFVEGGRIDAAGARALEATLERGNPFGGVPADRAAWAADLGVRVLRPGEATDVLYWVGCAGAFDPHGQRIARATARLLRAAGVDFAILGRAETCTGDPARRMGEEAAFREAATRVAETLGAVRFRRLVTHCAHCFHVFRNELVDVADGGAEPIHAVHHTQLLAELVEAGQLASRAVTGEPVTLHDPCYLARHNGETAAARTALAAAGAAPVEMGRSGDRTFCCGAGGGGAWVEVRQGSRIAALRMAEARATGARVVATACPFCALMLAGETQPGDIAVRDVAELLWESQPAGATTGVSLRPERA